MKVKTGQLGVPKAFAASIHEEIKIPFHSKKQKTCNLLVVF